MALPFGKNALSEKIRPIYAGDQEDFHWVGFGSGSGTNLRECAKVIKPTLIFSDKPHAKLFSLEELAQERGIIHLSIDGYDYCGSWKQAQSSPKLQEEYRKRSEEFNYQIVEFLHEAEKLQRAPFDLIVLGGYMRLVGEPLLRAYPDKIINVHPADLSLLTQKFERKYVGEDAVYDAIKAGEERTKSSVIMVDGGIDHGEILTQGPLVDVREDFLRMGEAEQKYCLREVADAHQSKQKEKSDWPALTLALKLIAEGRIALGTEKSFLNEWRKVYVDGKAAHYNGVGVIEVK